MSKIEYLTTLTKPAEEQCPTSVVQYKLHLQGTVDDWTDLSSKNHPELNEPGHKPPEGFDNKENILDGRCPATANAWAIEAFFDQFYRWTCDRFFCREVPAGWTAKADKTEVDDVILKQKQCTATSQGVYLEKMENCDQFLKKDPTSNNLPLYREGELVVCYRDYEGYLYVDVDADQSEELQDKFIWVLTPIYQLGHVGTFSKPKLLAYKPPNSETFMVAPDQTCQSYCKRVGGYAPVKDGYTLGRS